MNETDELPVQQDCIVRSSGFLRVPRGFRKIYPNCVHKTTQTPITTQRTNADGSISLIYTYAKGVLKTREEWLRIRDEMDKKEI